MIRPFLASVTRISDLTPSNFDTAPLAREHWSTGDYVAGRVRDTRAPVTGIIIDESSGTSNCTSFEFAFTRAAPVPPNGRLRVAAAGNCCCPVSC